MRDCIRRKKNKLTVMNVVSAVEGETLSPPAVTVMDWIPAAAFAAAAAAASFLFLS